MIAAIFFAITLLSQVKDGVSVTVEADAKEISPAKSVFLTLTVRAEDGRKIEYPDLREKVVGFSLAEDFTEETCSRWRLVPESYSEVYKIKPFVVSDQWFGPVYFDPPPPRETVTGEMEIDPKRDFPPITLKLAAKVLCLVVLAIGLFGLVMFAVKFIRGKIKEHRMLPIERAWVELDRLVKRALPAKGRYKDFYVELTHVVRRYVQRKYSVNAPNLTTEEFLREFRGDELKVFLESADLVKFAGLKATVEMADEAVESARSYLKADSAKEKGGVPV